jgi:hypothetical protein
MSVAKTVGWMVGLSVHRMVKLTALKLVEMSVDCWEPWRVCYLVAQWERLSVATKAVLMAATMVVRLASPKADRLVENLDSLKVVSLVD